MGPGKGGWAFFLCCFFGGRVFVSSIFWKLKYIKYSYSTCIVCSLYLEMRLIEQIFHSLDVKEQNHFITPRCLKALEL